MKLEIFAYFMFAFIVMIKSNAIRCDRNAAKSCVQTTSADGDVDKTDFLGYFDGRKCKKVPMQSARHCQGLFENLHECEFACNNKRNERQDFLDTPDDYDNGSQPHSSDDDTRRKPDFDDDEYK